MDAFFTGLTKRQAMLLLTAVTFGGQEGVAAFDFLPDDEADVLRDRARQILAIPREQRVPFLVQEIKRFVTGHSADELKSVDARQVAEVLKNERPALTEVVLRSLPSSVVSDVRIELAQPVLDLTREVRPDILAIIRWKLERRLADAMPKARDFSVFDLLLLSAGDLLTLADHLGARVIAPMVEALAPSEREELLRALPPDQRHLLQHTLQSRQPGRRHDPAVAREALARAAEGGELRHAMRLSGIRRIARACIAQSPELAARVIEKQRGDLGRHLARCVSEERKAGNRGSEESIKREVLDELDRLAERGLIERPVRLPSPPLPHRQPSRGPVRELGSSAGARPSSTANPAERPFSGRTPKPHVSLHGSGLSSSGVPRSFSTGNPRVSSVSNPGATPRVSSSANPAAPPRIERGGAAAQSPYDRPSRRSLVVRPGNPLRGPRKP
jgi:hypothetical protein